MGENVLTVDAAFREGLRLVREKGLPAKGTDVPVLAALKVFEARSRGKETDARFAVQGPQYACRLILEAFAVGG